ncbi:9514_t:CDS:1, partial [Gigaspora rosea]
SSANSRISYRGILVSVLLTNWSFGRSHDVIFCESLYKLSVIF